MKTSNFRFIVGALAVALSAALSPLSADTRGVVTAMTASPSTASTALDAYIYGYSLVTTDVTRVQMSNVPKVEALRAPINQFINIPRYPPANYRGVSAPNADTLYSIAWLDVSEPMVFSHSNIGNRFH